ncbi:structural protein VP1 [Sulfolobus spindle-shaped virus 5]|uniref:Structural protein VP1 n=1 Tax=Sulfolobus spindle-shaped virus 5 TaxID=459291 RepID=B5KLF0_9VIRU|nr:virion structural protein [Sulfolobus spindle-shaped virus 5]ABV26226.1 structural protein VP1 [Sulfolobus spindle-shaped virus 5]AQQ16888.1 ORF1 [Sulfolobus spindle-shaped virus 3]
MEVWSKLKITHETLRVAKNPHKFFTKDQIEEAIKIFYQTWDGNIVSSARKFVEVASKNPKLTRGEATNIGAILGLFIFILIGIVLLPVIVSQVNNLTSGTTPSVTGTNATLLQLVPLFYILVLIIVPAVVAYKIYKD